MPICVGRQSSDDPSVVWTNGTGIAACGRADEHGAHTFKAFPMDWPAIETWREPARIEHMLKGRCCPMCGDRTVRRVCQHGCKRDWNDAETMRRFTTADDRWTR